MVNPHARAGGPMWTVFSILIADCSVLTFICKFANSPGFSIVVKNYVGKTNLFKTFVLLLVLGSLRATCSPRDPESP